MGTAVLGLAIRSNKHSRLRNMTCPVQPMTWNRHPPTNSGNYSWTWSVNLPNTNARRLQNDRVQIYGVGRLGGQRAWLWGIWLMTSPPREMGRPASTPPYSSSVSSHSHMAASKGKGVQQPPTVSIIRLQQRRALMRFSCRAADLQR